MAHGELSKRVMEVGVEALALPLPPAATRAIAMTQSLARSLRWAEQVQAHTRTVGGAFGIGLFERFQAPGRSGVWGQTIARRFTVGKLRPESIVMTLSPYLPPQQQLRSSRG